MYTRTGRGRGRGEGAEGRREETAEERKRTARRERKRTHVLSSVRKRLRVGLDRLTRRLAKLDTYTTQR